MATKISIRGLRVFAHHGVFEFERAYGQDFFIDCDVWVDAEAAAANDDLAATVNYGALADALVADAEDGRRVGRDDHAHVVVRPVGGCGLVVGAGDKNHAEAVITFPPHALVLRARIMRQGLKCAAITRRQTT